jgi:drug/metabolite transporter (DMT)-like permease
MRHYLYGLGAILCWASLPAATGSGLQGMSTEELMFYSFSFAAAYLYLQDLLSGKGVRIKLPGLKASLLGVWGIFLYHYVYYLALDNAPLAEAAILATTWSFWIVVFSSLLLFRRLRFSVVVTALVGLFGAGLVISAGQQLAFQTVHLKGYLLALLCGLIWSSFSVALSRLRLPGEPMTVFTLYAALLSLLLFLATMPHGMPSPQALLAAAYLGCVPLGLSFFLWNRAMSGGNVVLIGFLSYLVPPLAVLLVALIHRQVVTPQVLWGMAVILGASFVGRLLARAEQQRGRGSQ